MVQGGDPTGTGKGGESIWGGKMEDEFHPQNRVRVLFCSLSLLLIFSISIIVVVLFRWQIMDRIPIVNNSLLHLENNPI